MTAYLQRHQGSADSGVPENPCLQNSRVMSKNRDGRTIDPKPTAVGGFVLVLALMVLLVVSLVDVLSIRVENTEILTSGNRLSHLD